MEQLKNANSRFKAFAKEFGLTKSENYPENIAGGLFRITSYALILGVSYLLIRSITVNNLLTSDSFLNLVKKLYDDNWFEVIFISLVVLLIVSIILRLLYPVRFSFRTHKVLTIGFIVFAIEKLYWCDFMFFPSKLVGIDYEWILLSFPFIEILLRVIYVLTADLNPENNSLFIENLPVIIPDSEVVRKSIVTNLANEIRKSYFKSSYSIGIVGDWGPGRHHLLKPWMTL